MIFECLSNKSSFHHLTSCVWLPYLPHLIISNTTGMSQLKKCIHSFYGKTWRETSTESSRSRYEDNIKLTLKKQDGRMWNGSIWLRTKTRVGL